MWGCDIPSVDGVASEVTQCVAVSCSVLQSDIPSVDGVASEVTHQVAVTAEGTTHVVVELAVDAQVEGLARSRLAHCE